MRRLVALLYLLVGAAHLLPALGVLSARRLEALYGVSIAGDPNLVVLMRHRAVLLGIVGALLAGAAFRSTWRPVAILAGFASMVSFMALALAESTSNSHIVRVAAVDGLLCALLAAAAVVHTRAARRA